MSSEVYDKMGLAKLAAYCPINPPVIGKVLK